MNTNFQIIFDEEIEIIAKKILSTGWIREDIAYFTKNIKTNNEINNTKISICLYHEILNYYNRNPDIRKSEIWVRCRIIIPDKWEKYEISLLKEIINEEFKNLQLTTFYDEDAYLGIFTKPKMYDKNLKEISFYINPDYPKGYWCNHTIN